MKRCLSMNSVNVGCGTVVIRGLMWLVRMSSERKTGNGRVDKNGTFAEKSVKDSQKLRE